MYPTVWVSEKQPFKLQSLGKLLMIDYFLLFFFFFNIPESKGHVFMPL